MKRVFAITASIVILTTAAPAYAAINFDGKTYVSPSAVSSTQSVGSLVKDFSVADINSGQSGGAGLGILGKISNFFNRINTWLKDKAGINLLGILTTIGHWFVITLEFIIKAVKAVL